MIMNQKGIEQMKKQHFKKLFKGRNKVRCFVQITTEIQSDGVNQILRIYIPKWDQDSIPCMKVYSFNFYFFIALSSEIPNGFESSKDEYFELLVEAYGSKCQITKLIEVPIIEDYLISKKVNFKPKKRDSLKWSLFLIYY